MQLKSESKPFSWTSVANSPNNNRHNRYSNYYIRTNCELMRHFFIDKIFSCNAQLCYCKENRSTTSLRRVPFKQLVSINFFKVLNFAAFQMVLKWKVLDFTKLFVFEIADLSPLTKCRIQFLDKFWIYTVIQSSS